MPYTDADIRFYHGQRKKNQGFSKDSTEEFDIESALAGLEDPFPEEDEEETHSKTD